MKTLICTWELFARGTTEVLLCEIDDCTPDGVEDWVRDEAHMQTFEQGNFEIRLFPDWSDGDLEDAIAEHTKRPDGDE